MNKPKTANIGSSTLYMNNWDKGVAPAICPCIFSACDIEFQPEPLSTFYCLLASSRSGSTISGGINMQGNIAGATPTSRGSYTM